MKIKSTLIALIGLFGIVFSSSHAFAQWELDSTRSAVNFVSIKNNVVAETHSFGSLVGYIGEQGKTQLSIDLASVQTAIEIRNERMRELLFETALFPTATIAAEIDASLLAALNSGDALTTDVQVDLSLHGVTKSITASLVAVAEEGGSLRVISARPILLQAADFGLGDGVTALQKIAGLDSISTAVPVTLNLLFVPVK